MAVVISRFQEVLVEGVATVQEQVPVVVEEVVPSLSAGQKERIRMILRGILQDCERPSEVKKAVIRRLGHKYEFPAPSVICRKSLRRVAIFVNGEEISVEL